MNCFYHNSVDAIGICKNCNRGLCLECAADLVNGIACKNRCESEVEAVNELINRNKKSHEKANYAYTRNALVYLFLGLIFLAYGVSELRRNSVLIWLILPAGIVFLLGALFSYSTGRKYSNNNSHKG